MNRETEIANAHLQNELIDLLSEWAEENNEYPSLSVASDLVEESIRVTYDSDRYKMQTQFMRDLLPDVEKIDFDCLAELYLEIVEGNVELM